MANTKDRELTKDVVILVQECGSEPGNKVFNWGCDFASLSDVTDTLNNVEPVYRLCAGQYYRAGFSIKEPTSTEFTMAVTNPTCSVNALIKAKKAYTVRKAHGCCGANGQDKIKYVEIMSNAKLKSRKRKGYSDTDATSVNEIEATLVAEKIYDALALKVSEVIPSAYGLDAAAPFVGVAFPSGQKCITDNCADSTTWYAVTTSGQVYFRVNGGSLQMNQIAPFTAGDTPKAIAVVNGILVVAFAGGFYTNYMYAGVPTQTWAKVTSGAVGANTINDITNCGQYGLLGAANGGAVIQSSSPTSGMTTAATGATTENLLRAYCFGDSLIAVGANRSIVRSTDGGNTWSLVPVTSFTAGNPLYPTTAIPSNASITSLQYVGSKVVISTSVGTLYFTSNFDDLVPVWTQLPNPTGSSNAINDLIFATDEVSYVLQGSSILRALDAQAGSGTQELGLSATNFLSGYNSAAVTAITRIGTPTVGHEFDKANYFVAVGANATVGKLFEAKPE